MAYRYPATTTGKALAAATDAAAARSAINADYHLNVKDYGAVGDAVALTDATITSGSAVCTSASNAFTASMVGKTIVVAGAGSSDGLTALITTVASYQSAGQITLGATASHAALVAGGPNVSAIIGTDNSATFASALSSASAAAVAAGSNRARFTSVSRVFVPGGNYLVTTGVPALQVQGISLVGDGALNTRIWHCGPGAFLQMGTYSATPAHAWEGIASDLHVSHLTLSAPVYSQSTFVNTRPGYGIQDNGSGGLHLDNVVISGFKYGVYAAYGSDFSRIGPTTYFRYCDVGVYLGPGGEQILLQGVDFLLCEEGLVNEGAMQGALVGCSFEDNYISDITYDGNATGTTRSGVPWNTPGAYYLGAWTHVSCWFETGAGGNPARSNSHHVWITSTALFNGASRGWLGLTFRDCLIVSGGGAQISGGTNAFIADGGTKSANPVIEGLRIVGDRLNGVYYYYGAAATSGAILKDWSPPVPQTGIEVVPFLGGSVGAAISGPTTDLVSTSGSLTLTSPVLNNPTIKDSAGKNALTVLGAADAVNYLEVRNSADGSPVQVFARGATNVDLYLRPSGTGNVRIVGNTGADLARFNAPASAVNYWWFNSATTGNSISAEVKTVSGSDPNVSMKLVPRGTGAVQVPSGTGGYELYNTADQTTNYEKLVYRYTSNVAEIGTNFGGTGTARTLKIGVGASAGTALSRYLQINSTVPNYQFHLNTGATGSMVEMSTPGGGGLAASSGNQTALSINPTIAQSGTASYTMLLINPTDGSLGSGTKLLIDAQAASVSKFKVDNTGAVSVSGTAAVWKSGTGSPLNVVTAPVGSMYTRTDGGANTTLYVKESGTDATGWVPK